MKQFNKFRFLYATILMLLAVDCRSADDDIFEISTVVSYVTVYLGTSSNDINVVHGATDNELKAIQFAQLNEANLTADMAKGQGEFLATVADLLGIPSAKKIAFYAMTKNKFTQLIPNSHTTAAQLVFNLKTESAKL